MTIIVDSGSTKADWRVKLDGELILSFKTKGINPLFFNEGACFSDQLPEALQKDEVRKIYFYAAGCSSAVFANEVHKLLSPVFTRAAIDVFPDTLAAARALFHNNKGIAVILGTGASCCYYNGKDIECASNSLGYILGDEGSGADLGKRLLRAYFYGKLPQHLLNDPVLKNLTRAEVLQAVYKSSRPNAYLASLFPIFERNKHDAFLHNLVEQSFLEFFDYHLMPLWKEGLPIGAIGSVAYFYSDIFESIAHKKGIEQVSFIQYPADELLQYHCVNC